MANSEAHELALHQRMSAPALSPAAPHGIIVVDGIKYDSWALGTPTMGLGVDQTTGEASQALWKVFDPDYRIINKYTAAKQIVNSNMERLVNIDTVEIWLGFGDDLGESWFKGKPASVEYGAEDGRGITTFRFYDMSYSMRKVQKNETHKNIDPIQLMAKLAERNGVNFEGPIPAIKSALEKFRALKQEAKTDWDLMKELADDVGLQLFTLNDTLFAKEAAKVGTPVITLVHKKDFHLLRDFSCRVKLPDNIEGRHAQVEAHTRGAGGKRVTGRSKSHRLGSSTTMLKRDMKIKTRRNAEMRANAIKALQRDHAFSNTFSALPAWRGRHPNVRDTIGAYGLPDIFSGEYLIDRVSQSLRAGQMQTRFDVYRDIEEG